ncbi:MAG: hypothetical protein NVSMB52_10790 [Chloroflexota bacterium]
MEGHSERVFLVTHRDSRTISKFSALKRAAAASLMLGAAALASLPQASTSFAAHPGSHPAVRATINVGTKNFGEEYLISDMYKLLLQKAGFNVNIHDLATTAILQPALVRGSIDLYPEYTGTGFSVVLKHTRINTNAIQTYAIVKSQYQKKFHLTWLVQSPMNDTNDVAVTQSTATKYHLHTLSDLAKVSSQLSFAGLPECKDRPDCLGGLQNAYGIKFKNVTYLGSQPLMYKGLSSGQFDAIEVFTTDGPIRANHLVVLADNKHAVFPADHIAPVVRDTTLAKYPQIRTILNRLPRYLTTQAIIRLNVQVVLNSADPLVVARQFLRSKHLL